MEGEELKSIIRRLQQTVDTLHDVVQGSESRGMLPILRQIRELRERQQNNAADIKKLSQDLTSIDRELRDDILPVVQEIQRLKLIVRGVGIGLGVQILTNLGLVITFARLLTGE